MSCRDTGLASRRRQLACFPGPAACPFTPPPPRSACADAVYSFLASNTAFSSNRAARRSAMSSGHHLIILKPPASLFDVYPTPRQPSSVWMKRSSFKKSSLSICFILSRMLYLAGCYPRLRIARRESARLGANCVAPARSR